MNRCHDMTDGGRAKFPFMPTRLNAPGSGRLSSPVIASFWSLFSISNISERNGFLSAGLLSRRSLAYRSPSIASSLVVIADLHFAPLEPSNTLAVRRPPSPAAARHRHTRTTNEWSMRKLVYMRIQFITLSLPLLSLSPLGHMRLFLSTSHAYALIFRRPSLLLLFEHDVCRCFAVLSAVCSHVH